MKLHNAGYKMVNDLLKNQTIDTKKIYRLSNFVHFELLGDRYYLLNSLSGFLLSLDKYEFALISGDSFSKENISNDLLQQLLDTHTVVNIDEDEVATFNSLKALLKTINNDIPLKKYTILTTTRCNAHCFYCFENCLGKETMDEKTAADVVDYILRTKSDSKIVLQWFGGEPLYNENAINYICSNLKQNNVNFTSRITTNGYLFDPDKLNIYSKLWNLELATITLDGTEEEHNARKNFDKNCSNPFKKILQNIVALCDSKIYVNIRVNFDANNFENCKELITLLNNKIGENEFVKIVPTMLYGERLKSVENWLDMEIQLYNLVYKYNYSKLAFPNQIMLNPCKATDESSIIITPSGKICACEHCEPDMIFGDIYHGIKLENRYREWLNPNYEYRYKECYNCPHLPVCHLSFGKCSIANDINRCKKIFENKYHLLLTSMFADKK